MNRFGDYSITVEPYSDELGVQIFPMWTKHEEEAGLGYELNPRFDVFFDDNYFYFVLRFGHEVVGYLSFSLVYHHHYDLMMAQQDLLYVHPDHRSYQIASFLIKTSEQELKKIDGLKAIVQSSRAKKDISPLFIRYGYEEVDKLYMKRL